MSTRITLPLLATMVCLALLPGCLGFIGNQARFRETRHITTAHQPGSAIRVDTANGSVTLGVGEGQEVQIEATLKCTTQQRLDETEVVANRVNGALVVEVKWPGDRRQNGEGCSFNITLPDATGVEVHTGNGSVRSTGLAGAANLHTSNGSITVVKHDGAVEAKTSNGKVTVESAAGDVLAGSSNGAIDVQSARGKVDASTSNGKVSVTLAETSPGPVRLRTSNGGIDLTVGPSFAGELSMSTSNGGLNVGEIPNVKRLTIQKNSGVIVFGEGGGASEVHTSNGGIHVQMAGGE